MTPVSIMLIILLCIGVGAYFLVKVVEALYRIARRIEATNTHLDDIHTDIAKLSEMVGKAFAELQKTQTNHPSHLEELITANMLNDDPLLDEAVDIVTQSGKASASLLQRRLDIGYARAAKLIDQLEMKGYVGPAKGSYPRKILKRKEDMSEDKTS